MQAATQLLSAARDGDVATVRRVLNEGEVDVNVMDEVSVGGGGGYLGSVPRLLAIVDNRGALQVPTIGVLGSAPEVIALYIIPKDCSLLHGLESVA